LDHQNDYVGCSNWLLEYRIKTFCSIAINP